MDSEPLFVDFNSGYRQQRMRLIVRFRPSLREAQASRQPLLKSTNNGSESIRAELAHVKEFVASRPSL